MTFEELGYFVELSKSLNFTKAADRLYISQPSLSRHISNLEESLGAQLMVRTKRNVQLTEIGQYLAQEGEKLLKQKSLIEETIWQMESSADGKLTIATIASRWPDIYRYSGIFQMKYPSVSFTLQHQKFGSVLSDLHSGTVDIVVANDYEIENDYEGIQSLQIAKGSFQIIVPENHKLAKKNSITKSDLKDERFLVAQIPAPTKFCGNVHGLFGVDTLDPRVLNHTKPRSIEAMIMQVRAGLGIAALPSTIVIKNDGYVALDVTDVDTSFCVCLYWLKDNQNPTIQDFVDTVKSEQEKIKRELKKRAE